MKKVIIILIAVVSVILVAFFGWFLFFRNPNIPAGESIRNILPFGSGGDANTPALPANSAGGEESEGQLPVDEFGTPAAKLFRISNTPVAGFVAFVKNNQMTVRYVDRATGHIYDTDLATLVKTKVTNQTLPKIYEAYFRPDGNAILLRSLKDDSDVIGNSILTLTPPKSISVSTSSPQATDTLYTVSSTAVRGDISAIAVGSSNTLFYALRDTSTVVSSSFNSTSTKTLFASPFNNWRLVTAENSLVLYTKASASVPGYSYMLNISSGALTKILGPLNGLVSMPSVAGGKVLYSYFENNAMKLFVKDLQSNAVSEILPATLAEKCVWSAKDIGTFFCGTPIENPRDAELDNWYRGLTHFSDYVWRFDTDSEIAQLLVEPQKELGLALDVFEPKLSPNEDYLIFINKTDLSLWALKLEQAF